MSKKKEVLKKEAKETVLLKKEKAVKKEKVAKAVPAADANIYPIGKLLLPATYSEAVINKLIQDIHVLPEQLKAVSKKINKKKKLTYSYREGGWNVEQIIHHIADSHMNALVRFKLTLTENNPTVKPYDENLWAETVDNQLPVKNSIRLLKAIHAKWTILLENMDKNDFKRTYFHPEMNRTVSLEEMLATYAWHGKHHVAQIAVALKNG
ncbi:MAG TPA: putative metal-dependent hydrolase [Chitinophagales bacterium]|nr:putative metal-dependent hydrolase [Chitinophagales bacterium]HQO30762.1 putative metal-dependent hydrolase [Chitinophagales bacterium]HQO88633.1 putative metal-dependent hydrolase [Chitinophagales bacterium]